DIAKILYDDRICTFDIECISSSLPRRIRQSLRDAGFELELGEEK
ncbi:hypothetical protein HZA33_01790, partial [Candidatus Pacearchaeota archaeon]|nr:hypothetical protein [Candidatus Pacearchaeota archaeon]